MSDGKNIASENNVVLHYNKAHQPLNSSFTLGCSFLDFSLCFEHSVHKRLLNKIMVVLEF